jgi:hypothetical protein
MIIGIIIINLVGDFFFGSIGLGGSGGTGIIELLTWISLSGILIIG